MEYLNEIHPPGAQAALLNAHKNVQTNAHATANIPYACTWWLWAYSESESLLDWIRVRVEFYRTGWWTKGKKWSSNILKNQVSFSLFCSQSFIINTVSYIHGKRGLRMEGLNILKGVLLFFLHMPVPPLTLRWARTCFLKHTLPRWMTPFSTSFLFIF